MKWLRGDCVVGAGVVCNGDHQLPTWPSAELGRATRSPPRGFYWGASWASEPSVLGAWGFYRHMPWRKGVASASVVHP